MARSKPIRHLLNVLILVFSTLQFGTCWATASIHGVVVTNAAKGKPFPNVAVSIIGEDGQHQTSNSNGSFTIQLSQRKPGDLVRLIAERKGWEVVNRYSLDHTLSANPTEHIIEIVMAPTDQYTAMATSYYGLSLNTSVEKNYQRKLATIEAKGNVNGQDIQRLREERDIALNQAQELARELASRQSRDDSFLYAQAIRLFTEGNIDAALNILNEERLQKDTDKIYETRIKNRDAWRLRAYLLAIKFDFQGAGRIYRKIVELMPEDALAWIEYGDFNYSQNNGKNAQQGYKEALAIFRRLSLINPKPYLSDVARILDRLGIVFLAENKFTDSLKAHEEALKIRRNQANTNPELYLSRLASTLSNLGNAYKAGGRKEEAFVALRESIDIDRKLAKINPGGYLPGLAGTLINIGNLYKDQNSLKEARDAYSEALYINRSLSQKDPEHLPNVAAALGSLSIINILEKREFEAITSLNEVKAIYHTLALSNSDKYLPELAAITRNIALFYMNTSQPQESYTAFNDAISIYQKLSLSNQNLYLYQIALTLNDIGVLHRINDNHAKAEITFNEAIAIYRQLNEQNPDTNYLRDIAFTLNNIGTLEAGGDALTIFRNLAKKNPDLYLPSVAMVLTNLGIFHKTEGRRQEAFTAFNEALNTYEQLTPLSTQSRLKVDELKELLKGLN